LLPERERVLVRVSGREAMIERWPPRSTTPEWTARLSVDDARGAQAMLASHEIADDAEVTIIAPRTATLAKTFSMPGSVEPNLESVLHHELDRLTPFAPGELAFDYHIDGRDTVAGRLCVEVVLIRQTVLNGLVEAIERWGIRPNVITVAGREQGLSPFNLLRRQRRFTWPLSRLPFKPTMAAVALVAALVALYLPAMRYERLLAEYEPLAHAQRQQAVAARAAVEEGQAVLERIDYLNQRRREYVPPVDLLLELTDRFPEHIFVSRLSITRDAVHVQGEAGAASGVLELIESIDQLRDAEFQSPVTRSSTTGKEQFSVAAALTASTHGSAR
jgi:general secretion pathway protein L